MKVLVLFCVFALSLADEDGRYGGGDNSGQYVPNGDEGQYVPDYSGQYIPDGTGGYRDDGSGRYGPDGSGRYSGQFNGINGGNLLGAGTSQNRKIIQAVPVVQIKSNTIRSPPPAPRPQRQPQPTNSYSNQQEGKWKIIRQLGDVDTDGYHWEYETENKIIAEESGKLHNKGTDAESIRAKGFFQYTGPDNVVYSVTYTADENGFFPVADHLPTPPPIPDAILKALESNRAKR